jgi:CheY-like chemotaxis protein
MNRSSSWIWKIPLPTWATGARNLVDGLILAQELDLDVAVLDVNLAGLTSTKIADLLDEKGVPFLLVTGYTTSGIPERLRNSLRVGKPFENAELGQALQELLGAKAPPTEAVDH